MEFSNFYRLAVTNSSFAYDRWHPEEHTIIERESSLALMTETVGGSHRHVSVMIAGTNDLEDLAQAAFICEKENQHRGFYLHTLRIKKAIERRIRPGDAVTITGHSLGGVCAQFLSLDIANKVRRVRVFSIGAPKGFRKPVYLPGNVEWYLWENDLDAIPEYPLTKPFDWGLMEEYNPYNFRRYILINGDRGEPRGKWTKFLDLLRPSLRSFSPRFTFDETVKMYHSLAHYETFVS